MLIIINGPCGIGKSTAAKNLHESLPLSYLIDVDEIGRKISHYREFEEERREIREAVAFATVDAVLNLGRTAIVEKMIYSEDVLNTYRSIAEKYHIQVHEIILWAPKETVMQRAHERGWRKGGLLTPEKCELFWHKIDKVKDLRKHATTIDISDMNEREVLKAIQKLIN